MVYHEFDMIGSLRLKIRDHTEERTSYGQCQHEFPLLPHFNYPIQSLLEEKYYM